MNETMMQKLEMTGYANGDKFESEAQVRDYFTVASMNDMFSPGEVTDLTQDELDEMAEWVIESRNHCDF